MGRWFDWIGNGRPRDSGCCSVCGRALEPTRARFILYGQTICEDCFWKDGVAYSPALPEPDIDEADTRPVPT